MVLKVLEFIWTSKLLSETFVICYVNAFVTTAGPVVEHICVRRYRNWNFMDRVTHLITENISI